MYVIFAPKANENLGWYETQLTVGADVYKMEGYPEKINHSS